MQKRESLFSTLTELSFVVINSQNPIVEQKTNNQVLKSQDVRLGRVF